MCCGSSHGWGHQFAPGLFFVGSQQWGHPCDNGVTHSEKARKCQNPFSLEASVALRGGSSLPRWENPDNYGGSLHPVTAPVSEHASWLRKLLLREQALHLANPFHP